MKDNASSVIDMRPIDGKLTGKKIPISEFIYRPRNILLTDDMLVVYDEIENNKFKFFSYPDIKYLFSWGIEGGGPNEIDFINNTGRMKTKKNTFTFLDRYELKTYEIVDINKIKLVRKVQLTNTEGALNRFEIINDSLFFAALESMPQSNKEYVFLYPNENKGITFGEFPDNNFQFGDLGNERSYYYQTTAVSDVEERIIMIYSRKNLIEIYDLSGNLIKTVNFNGREYNGPENDWFSEIISGWTTFQKFKLVTDTQYIYALYYGVNLKDYEVAPRSLVVLNWESEILKRYEIDLNSYVDLFVVSEKYNKIYGLTAEGGQHIIEFDLPEIE